MNKKVKVMAAAILIMAAAAGGFALLQPSSAEDERQEVSYTELARGGIVKTIEASGKIASVESKNVSAVTDRIVKKIYVKQGEKVKAGQVLAQLDVSSVSQELEKSRRQAQDEIISAQREKEVKEREYKNAKFSYDLGTLSQEDLFKAQKASENADFDYEKKKNAPEGAELKKQLQEGTLKAPISGTVTVINGEEGVMSSGVLFVIEDVDHLKVDSMVSEYDVNDIKPGMKAVIKTEMTDSRQFVGKVLSVAIAAQRNTAEKGGTGKVLFPVSVGITEASPLVKIGGSAQVSIISEEKNGIFAVPFDALVKRQGENSIYAADRQGKDFVVKEIKVTTGLENDVSVEISGEGLTEGLKVLKSPEALTPGQKIKIEDGDGADKGTAADEMEAGERTETGGGTKASAETEANAGTEAGGGTTGE